MLILWLRREFYRDMYGNTGGIEPLTPDLGDKLGDHFGDLATKCRISKILDFFNISIRGRDPDLSRRFHATSLPGGKTINRPCSDHRAVYLIDLRMCVDRLGSPLESESLWSLS
ncbi:hypothetical protein AVEN_187178-1 [Araneus ventricosus]|uniref:Uncharacterized protein n=1 Tax=Araneus ventricosus TaxID=182803 RepID=A0A4Y2JGH2_ARAVE|nr:hypothetical protein AVEN_187178-1 [Araneus ventricosus]